MKRLKKAVKDHIGMCLGAFIGAPIICLVTYLVLGDKMAIGSCFFVIFMTIYCGCIGALFDYSDIGVG